MGKILKNKMKSVILLAFAHAAKGGKGCGSGESLKEVCEGQSDAGCCDSSGNFKGKGVNGCVYDIECKDDGTGNYKMEVKATGAWAIPSRRTLQKDDFEADALDADVFDNNLVQSEQCAQWGGDG